MEIPSRDRREAARRIAQNFSEMLKKFVHLAQTCKMHKKPAQNRKILGRFADFFLCFVQILAFLLCSLTNKVKFVVIFTNIELDYLTFVGDFDESVAFFR